MHTHILTSMTQQLTVSNKPGIFVLRCAGVPRIPHNLQSVLTTPIYHTGTYTHTHTHTHTNTHTAHTHTHLGSSHRRMPGHMTGFDAVCFSPDGTNIVSGGDHSAVVGCGLWGATMPQGDRRRGKSERQSERQSERERA